MPGPALPLLLAGDTPVAVTLARGRGRVVALAGPDALANARLDLADNLQLLANLAAPGRVYFDEYHHRAGTSAALTSLVRLLAPTLAQLLALGLALAWAAGRRLGPVRAPLPPPGRTSRAYATQLGALYRRARAESALSADLRRELRATLERRAGIGATLSDEAAVAALSSRRPELGRTLEGVLRALRSSEQAPPPPERYAALARASVELQRAV
jgi:hypothetical protein